MKTITINCKQYLFEFSIEASLYSEVTEKVTSLMFALDEAGDADDIQKMVSSLADVPKTSLTMFYAGLLEHHSHEIRSIEDAKKLVKEYFAEDKEQNFYTLMQDMIECMHDDGFFKQIGLEQMMAVPTEKEVKTPQDHKKKTTAKPKVTEK